MARTAVKELSDLAVKNLKAPGIYALGGAAGLYLRISATGDKSLFFRITTGTTADGKQIRREIGLGKYPVVSLKQARNEAHALRAKVDKGIDPVLEKKQARAKAAAERAAEITFKVAARRLIEAKDPGWKDGGKTRQMWENTLAKYAFPVIGELPVRLIDTPHIIEILLPIWSSKNETADRVRNRIENILDWAIAYKYREHFNPARWRGHLEHLLATPGDVVKKGNHPALPVEELQRFLAHLNTVGGMGARALNFAILTAARSGEVRGATWAEIDLTEGIWTIPPERAKTEKEHRVPLSEPALKLLKELPRIEGSDFVFPGARQGSQLSDATLAKVVKDMNEANIKAGGKGYQDPKQKNRIATPHGFRSTFRDWAAEFTDYPNQVVEMALAHAIPSAVEAAYRRGDLFNKRRELMTAWADYCGKIKD